MLLNALNPLSFWGIIFYDGLGCRTRKKLPGRVRQVLKDGPLDCGSFFCALGLDVVSFGYHGIQLWARIFRRAFKYSGIDHLVPVAIIPNCRAYKSIHLHQCSRLKPRPDSGPGTWNIRLFVVTDVNARPRSVGWSSATVFSSELLKLKA